MPAEDDAYPVPGGFAEEVPGAREAPAAALSDAPADAPAAAAEQADADLGFDMTRTFRVRSVYPFEGDGIETLTFDANQVLVAHPALNGAKIEGDWTFGSLAANPQQKALIPVAYVVEMDQAIAAKALYDYEATSAEEATIEEGEILQIVDQSDPDWWLIAQGAHCLLVPANYVELC